MTTKKHKPGTKTSLLKYTLIAGSFAATLFSANLLAQHDASVEMLTEPLGVLIEPPIDWQAESQLLLSQQNNALISKGLGVLALSLEPIPTLVPVDTGLLVPIDSQAIASQAIASQPIASQPTVTTVDKTSQQFAQIPSVTVPSVAAQLAARTDNINQVLSFDLKQIPTVQIPAPVTRSRSSR
ncbi:MAG: hypothetical protein AAF702_02385 [Chloroflexota bacterium]